MRGRRIRSAGRWPGRGSVALIALTFAVPTFAQTGRIEGKVVDGDTGEPLVAAQIRVEDTDLGSYAREDGSYFIDAVPAGGRSLTTEYLGYEKGARRLDVPAGGVVTVNFALTSSMLDAPTIVAIVERPKWSPPEEFEAVVEISGLPADLPEDLPLGTCVVEVIKRSAYIEGGRWLVPHEVGHLRCGDAPPPCPHVTGARGRNGR